MRGTKTAVAARMRRHERVRKNVAGTEPRPRLAVYRSSAHIYAQVIDDARGHTIVAASDIEKELKQEKGKKAERATAVGSAIAKKALEAGVKAVVFDRGGYRYHGRVKALAEAARKGGLEF